MPVTLDPKAAKAIQAKALPYYTALMQTPIGPLALVQRGDWLWELRLHGELRAGETPTLTPLLQQAVAQLEAYLNGARTDFDLPLAPLGTPFQTAVWERLAHTVPYGQSVSYGELAKRCDQPAAARAVGMANHQNPLPILIPCHRVIGANGRLIGYGGGLGIKKYLLNLERVPYKEEG